MFKIKFSVYHVTNKIIDELKMAAFGSLNIDKCNLWSVFDEHFNTIGEGGDIDGLAQDCSRSIAKALALLQSCTYPLIYVHIEHYMWVNLCL